MNEDFIQWSVQYRLALSIHTYRPANPNHIERDEEKGFENQFNPCDLFLEIYCKMVAGYGLLTTSAIFLRLRLTSF